MHPDLWARDRAHGSAAALVIQPRMLIRVARHLGKDSAALYLAPVDADIATQQHAEGGTHGTFDDPISLSLVTLLCGLSVAAYQLWSAEHARQDGQHSALAARYGGKPVSLARPEPRPAPPRDEPRIALALPQAELTAAPPPQADSPKRTRAPRRKPKPELSQGA